MQRYTVYLYLETALHVSGDNITHHQERKQLYLQHLVLCSVHSTLKPVPTLPRQRQVAVTAWQIPDAVDTAVCAPDGGWWYHPKHVGQFPDKINCNVASCWIYIRIFFTLIIHITKMNTWMPGMYFMCIFCICSINMGYNVIKMSEILILKGRRKLRERIILSNNFFFNLICLFHCSTLPYSYWHCEDLQCGMSFFFPSLIIYLALSK